MGDAAMNVAASGGGGGVGGVSGSGSGGVSGSGSGGVSGSGGNGSGSGSVSGNVGGQRIVKEGWLQKRGIITPRPVHNIYVLRNVYSVDANVSRDCRMFLLDMSTSSVCHGRVVYVQLPSRRRDQRRE